MKSFNNYIAEQEDSGKKGKKVSVGKSTVTINPNKEDLKEETPAERIDRISKEKVAQRAAASKAQNEKRDANTAAFQAHKKEVLAKGGRPVDALDSWQKKKMNTEELNFASVLDELTDEDLLFLSDDLIEEVVEEFFYETLEEGFEIEELETLLIEHVDSELTYLEEAKVTVGHDSDVKPAASRTDRLAKIKSAVHKVASGAKKVAKKVAHAAGEVAGSAVSGYKKASAASKDAPDATKSDSNDSKSDSPNTGTRSSSSSSKGTKRPGLLGRIASGLKSGLKKAVRGAGKAVGKVVKHAKAGYDEGRGKTTSASAPAAKPAATKPAAKPAAKPATPAAKQATAKKKTKSNLDNLLNQIRNESAVPGKPAERLGAVTAIPQKERDAARERTLAKAKEMREKNKKKLREDNEIEEGKQTFPYKKVAAKIKSKLSRSVYAKTDNSPVPNTTDAERKATTQMSKMARVYNQTKRADQNAAKARRSSTFYRDTHPASPPKMKKANESLSFSDFMEARRMDKEGVDRGDAARDARAERAKASVAAVKKRQAVLDKHEKKTGTKLDISKSVEGKAHARNHPGSRQAPKVKGQKETPQETQNRRVNRHNQRLIKHGPTTKERKVAAGYAAHERDYKKSYGQNKSAWD